MNITNLKKQMSLEYQTKTTKFTLNVTKNGTLHIKCNNPKFSIMIRGGGLALFDELKNNLSTRSRDLSIKRRALQLNGHSLVNALRLCCI